MLTPMALAPLPPRTRVFHIGTMKSGTTSVQRAAHRRRGTLRQHGVLYPGKKMNHFTPVAAFLGKRREGELPDLSTWDALMDQVRADEDNRVLLSHEWACEADDDVARGFVDALGDRGHVVITLRPLSGMLGSYWQEIVKNGQVTPPFEEWLADALAVPPGHRDRTEWDRQSDQAGIVERWARLIGPDRVTVVVVDKADPERVPTVLEQLLDLPQGMLSPEEDSTPANRSLSPAEAEFFRRQNAAFKAHGVPFREYALCYRREAVATILSSDASPADGRILLPTWAAERVTEYSRDITDRLARSGARIVGDLDSLRAPVNRTAPDGTPAPDVVPMDSAVQAVVASVLVGTGRAGGAAGTATTSRTTTTDVVKDRVRELPGGPIVLRGARHAVDRGRTLQRRLDTWRAGRR